MYAHLILTFLAANGVFLYLAIKIVNIVVHPDNLRKLKFTSDDIFNKYSIEAVTRELKASGFRDINHKYDNGYFINCRK